MNLTAEQVAELNKELSSLRHDVNNRLSLMVAAIELLRTKPHLAERMIATLAEQPPKVAAALLNFSKAFDRTLGLSSRKTG